MDLMLFVFAPPAVTFLALVFWRPGLGYLVTLMIVLVPIMAVLVPEAIAIYNYVPGPNGWNMGVFTFTAATCAVVVLIVSSAQTLRWCLLRKGQPGFYVLWLILAAVLAGGFLYEFFRSLPA